MRISLSICAAAVGLTSVGFLTSCAFPAGAAVQGRFDRTLHVTGPVDLDLQTGSGSVAVRQGNSAAVVIQARIHASGWAGGDAERRVHYLESHPPVEQNGNTIRIGHIQDHDLTHNISISYDLTVPAETKLHAASGSGSEDIEGIHGPVEAGSGSGSLRLSNIGSEVQAHAGSGSITLSSIHGSVQANTGSGSIRATGIAGGFTGRSGSGGVRLEQTAAGDISIGSGSGSIEIKGADGAVRAHTGSGNITAQGQPKGDWNLRTGSGSVKVAFPAGAAYDLIAHTGSGSISTSQPIEVQGKINRHDLRAKVHGGGSVVNLSTGSGSIRID
jgi:hypothetical protein